ncbi:MAG TPA: AraC family transcriptional regulator [Opitutaceae bacterium]|nr:AraC family transcriptional regulator [Opitutaceae bacterium]
MVTDAFASVRAAADEVNTSTSYFWDNQDRPREVWEVITIQRTTGGCGFFRDGKGVYRVTPGNAMVFSHREPTSYGFPEDATEAYRLRYVQVWPAPSVLPLFAQLRGDFGSVLPMPNRAESTALFNEVFTRYKQRTFRDRFHESELLHRMVTALYREQIEQTQTTDPIEFGFHYLRNHFRSPVNLKTVADECGVSREHFIRQFRQRFTEAPGAMLRRLRLEHADAMLSATRQTVEEVALSSGFTSANSFSRAFRQKFGRSPRSGGQH